jgi:phytol kinase
MVWSWSEFSGVVFSFLFVFTLIGAATVLKRYTAVNAYITRKVVHIGVSHWWLFAVLSISTLTWAVIGPISFIIINLLAIRFKFFKSMSAPEEENNLGTVYFPISLLILVILGWSGTIPKYLGAMAILIMGWGDGLSAIVGNKVRSPYIIIGKKRTSLAGSAAMFAASFAVTALILHTVNEGVLTGQQITSRALLMGTAATILEGFTPWGLDNITVPLGSTGLYYLIFL